MKTKELVKQILHNQELIMKHLNLSPLPLPDHAKSNTLKNVSAKKEVKDSLIKKVTAKKATAKKVAPQKTINKKTIVSRKK